MQNTYYSILLSIFKPYLLDVVEGPIEQYNKPLTLVDSNQQYLVRDLTLSKYPLNVLRCYDSEGIDRFLAFNEDVIIFPSGKTVVYTEDRSEEKNEDFKKLFFEIFDEYELINLSNVMCEVSHYKYLELMVPVFGPLVFEKPNGFHFDLGLIGAHGDKCGSYMRNMQSSRPNGFRIALLFLLTYTKLMEREKSDTPIWLLDNLPVYLERIKQAEVIAFGSSDYFD